MCFAHAWAVQLNTAVAVIRGIASMPNTTESSQVATVRRLAARVAIGERFYAARCHLGWVSPRARVSSLCVREVYLSAGSDQVPCASGLRWLVALLPAMVRVVWLARPAVLITRSARPKTC